MEDLIKNAIKTKNVTHKNKMPDYMLKAGINKGNINTDSGLKERRSKKVISQVRVKLTRLTPAGSRSFYRKSI